jgi:hypothetical protein
MILYNNSFLLENSKMTMNKMMSRLLVVVALTFLALPAFAGRSSESASCEELVEDSICFDDLKILCDATSAAGSLSTRDRNGLIGKVLSANVKLTKNKVIDAGGKLDNYETKLDDLNEARKEKITPEDYVILLREVLEAQMCLPL